MVELLMSILAAVVILGAVLSASLQHAAQRRVNAELNMALSAAINTLEELRSIPFADVAAMDGSDFDVPGVNGEPGGLEAAPDDGDDIPGEISVAVADSSGPAILYLATATVTWTGARGRQSISLEALVGERK